MKKENLYEVLGHVNEDYVAEAKQRKTLSSRQMKWGVLAACLCLVLACVLMLPGKEHEYTHDYAQMLFYNNAGYVICGEGEYQILQACGLPTVITSELAGSHISYIKTEDGNNFYPCEEEAAAELFAYAPETTRNIYILRIDSRYFVAIRSDEDGYHGLTDYDPMA